MLSSVKKFSGDSTGHVELCQSNKGRARAAAALFVEGPPVINSKTSATPLLKRNSATANPRSSKGLYAARRTAVGIIVFPLEIH